MADKENMRQQVRYEWKSRDGSPCSMTVFDVTNVEAEEAARACGWPGHRSNVRSLEDGLAEYSDSLESNQNR